MNIYLIQDGMDFGPYTWVEIYVGLQKGEWTDESVVRIECDPLPKTIFETGFWNEGADVGPLTWEEILFLLQEGCLDAEIFAKIEGETDYSTLAHLLAARPSLVGTQEPQKRTWLIPVCIAVGIVVVLLAGIAVFTEGRPKEIKQPVMEQTPVVAVSATPVEEASPVTATTPEPQEKLASLPETTPVAEPSVTPEPVTPQPVQETIALTPSPTPAPVAKAAQTPVPTIAKSTPSSVPQAPKIVGDFFSIRSVKFLKKPPKDEMGVWKLDSDVKNKNRPPTEFVPCLDVTVAARENIRSERLVAKAYFFDENKKLLASQRSPSPGGKKGDRNQYPLPVMFAKDLGTHVYFEIPPQIQDKQWKAVVVFGDRHEAQAVAYPPTASAFMLDYPEKKLVEDRSAKSIVRKPAMDPLIEHVVRTRNPNMPQITLFLRPPAGISDASEVEGVLAICILANGLEDMKRELRKEEMSGDYSGLLSFANKHKLAVLAWGARRLWDPGSNYDDLPREKAKEIDESLDTVANAWERGVKELGDKYGIPQKNFLLWGNCGSAQWAQRLCLRKPDYFLAIHVHMPGSYDKPTPEAAKVLWCLTIGELEGGYERSKRWVKTVREMGYPIVYKAIPGLGHSGHPDAAALGFEFFEFALQQKEKRNALDEKIAKNSIMQNQTACAWLEEFRSPFVYADIVNQETFPPDQVEMIPKGFCISLPTKKLADIWEKDE